MRGDRAACVLWVQSSLRVKLMQEYGGVTAEQYAELFHETRMEWMERDEDGWLAEHGFYPRVTEGR